MPNIGEVVVYSNGEKKWIVKFLTETGSMSLLSLYENKIIDSDTGTSGEVILAMAERGGIPEGAIYSIDEVISVSLSSMSYIIGNLVPGLPYFVRTAARNRLGYGRRRATAPASLFPPIQPPGEPTSLYNDESPPFLGVNSADSLLVHIGPPLFDGGSPILNFIVQWDTNPEFNSLDGLALGMETVNAKINICSACVMSFDCTTNTFAILGDDNTHIILWAQRVILIYFSDDGLSYQFSVTAASKSEIRVAASHIRSRSLDLMKSIDGSALGADIDALGCEYEIRGLSSRSSYYVRVAAQNGAMGTGKNINTVPATATPRGKLTFVNTPWLTVLDKNALKVNLTGVASDPPSNITAVNVEIFSKDKKTNLGGSGFGTQHIVSIDSCGLGLKGGKFSLTTGGYTVPLPGSVEVVRGGDIIKTSKDLSPYLTHGDTFIMKNILYKVHGQKKISSKFIPLSAPYDGDNDKFVTLFVRCKSSNISFNVSSEELRRSLESMQVIGNVDVRRSACYPDGFRWTITFMTKLGPQTPFGINTNSLIGSRPIGFSQAVVRMGVLPSDYQSVKVKYPISSIQLPNLLPGVDYYVRVTASNDHGDIFTSVTSPPFLSPGQIPGPPSAPFIKPHGEKSIIVTFEETASENGSPVTDYFVELAESQKFLNSWTLTRPTDHSMQRITTYAYSLPWYANSSFTLSMNDFRGHFTKEVPVLVGIKHRSSILKKESGHAALCDFLTRGDFVKVGGQTFRICLGFNNPVSCSENYLSLCSEDGWRAAFYDGFDGGDLHLARLLMLDSSLGSVRKPAAGASELSTISFFGLHNDIRGKITRGDLIRVGHPEAGETFRISTEFERVFDSQHVPLGAVEDSSLEGFLSASSLVHATYEVQKITLRAFESSIYLTPSSVLPSGFRLRFGGETTYITSSGGSEGCLLWDAEDYDLKAELEHLYAIDSVDVTKELIAFEEGVGGAGVVFYVTFTGLNVRGDVPLIELIDVGSNGCLNADDSGGKFSRHIEMKSVSEESVSFLPIFKVQTTPSIPYDATASQMKAAIESLSLVCTVDVSRNKLLNGFSWDVSFTSHKKFCDPTSPLFRMSANALHLSASIDPKISIVSFQYFQVPVAKTGVPYFVRLSAANKYGRGPATLSNPASIASSTQPPAPPRETIAEVLSASEALVQWEAPLFNGGKSITHYRVEYDSSSSFTGGRGGAPTGSIIVPASAANSISEVQAFTVMIDSSTLYLSGTFALEYSGQVTRPLRFDSTPDIVKAALNELCTITRVNVSRFMLCSVDDSDNNCQNFKRQGYTWFVTFLSPKYTTGQHSQVIPKSFSRYSRSLQIDGSLLFECSDRFGTNCTRSGLARAYTEMKAEVQKIEVGQSPFTIGFSGYTSESIFLPCTLSEFKRKIEDIEVVGDIAVSCLSCSDDLLYAGSEVSITFLSLYGDVPLLDISDINSTVIESVKGVSASVCGRATYSAIIRSLFIMRTWYVRAFACNQVGCGAPALFLPSPLLLFATAPSIVQDLSLVRKTGKSITVGWNAPVSHGGRELTDFVIEYSTSPAFISVEVEGTRRLFSKAENAESPQVMMSPKLYTLTIDDLIPGIDYYVRVAARSLSNLTGLYSYIGYPGSPKPVTPASVPESLYNVTLSSGASENELRLNFGRMENQRPEGSNGYPILGYHVDIATELSGLQRLTFTFSNAAFISGEYRLSLGYEQTRCIAFGAPAFDVEVFVEELPQVDEALVSFFNESLLSAKFTYDIKLIFSEPSGERELKLILDESDCVAINPPPTLAQMETVFEGATTFSPQIIRITSLADDAVMGSMQLSVSFEGDFINALTVRNNVVQVIVDAGSRKVNTMGTNLTGVLVVGEKIKILDEVVEISSVEEATITLTYYHVRGTGGAPQNVYVMDNRIGLGLLEVGTDRISVISEADLRGLVEIDDYIMFHDAKGKENIVQVRYIQSATKEIFLHSNFYGDADVAALFARKRVLIKTDATSCDMKKAIESLPGAGTVDVTRYGPSVSKGYSWMITFSSSDGPFLCPSMCLKIDTKTSRSVNFKGFGMFVATSARNGQPYYESLDSAAKLSFNIDSKLWQLAVQGNSSLMSIPLYEWGNSIAFTDALVPLTEGTNACVVLDIEQVSQKPVFSQNIVFSKTIAGRISEVQKIRLTAEENDIKGFFRVSFSDPNYEVALNWDVLASDLAHQLMSLPSIGRVVVSRSPNSKCGFTWYITFLSNNGDLDNLQLCHLEDELRGTNVKLEIFEEVKGVAPDNVVIADGLDPGLLHVARVAAFNSEGKGIYTTSIQNKGKGVIPLYHVTKASPSKPEVFVKAVSPAEVEIKYSPSDPHGDPIKFYKVEWTTDSTFGTPEVVEISVRSAQESNIKGSFRIFLEDDETHYVFGKTQPITFGASAAEFRAAFLLLPGIGDMAVERTMLSASEGRWRVTFEKRTGNVGSLSVDSTMLVSIGNRYVSFDCYSLLF